MSSVISTLKGQYGRTKRVNKYRLFVQSNYDALTMYLIALKNAKTIKKTIEISQEINKLFFGSEEDKKYIARETLVFMIDSTFSELLFEVYSRIHKKEILNISEFIRITKLGSHIAFNSTECLTHLLPVIEKEKLLGEI